MDSTSLSGPSRLWVRMVSWDIGGNWAEELDDLDPSSWEVWRACRPPRLAVLGGPLPLAFAFEFFPPPPPVLPSLRIRNISSIQQSGQLTSMTFHPPSIFFFRNRIWGCFMHRPLSSYGLGSAMGLCCGGPAERSVEASSPREGASEVISDSGEVSDSVWLR